MNQWKKICTSCTCANEWTLKLRSLNHLIGKFQWKKTQNKWHSTLLKVPRNKYFSCCPKTTWMKLSYLCKLRKCWKGTFLTFLKYNKFNFTYNLQLSKTICHKLKILFFSSISGQRLRWKLLKERMCSVFIRCVCVKNEFWHIPHRSFGCWMSATFWTVIIYFNLVIHRNQWSFVPKWMFSERF